MKWYLVLTSGGFGQTHTTPDAIKIYIVSTCALLRSFQCINVGSCSDIMGVDYQPHLQMFDETRRGKVSCCKKWFLQCNKHDQDMIATVAERLFPPRSWSHGTCSTLAHG